MNESIISVGCGIAPLLVAGVCFWTSDFAKQKGQRKSTSSVELKPVFIFESYILGRIE